jgi:transcriptional regulator with XRE-family HTH domain
MNFADALKAWNGGIERGAQTRLAKALKVAPNTVSQWARAESPLLPGEEIRPRLARELGITVDALMQLFQREPAMFVRDSGSPYAGDLAARVAALEQRVADLEADRPVAPGETRTTIRGSAPRPRGSRRA